VPNFKLNDLLIHALALHFAHSSMPESVHPRRVGFVQALNADYDGEQPLEKSPWCAIVNRFSIFSCCLI
jgi:hypothetical protein